MARSAYQQFVADYMKGRASANFRENAGLMREAAAAWRRRAGTGGRGRRNPVPPGRPGGRALAVRSNPGGLQLNATTLALAGVAAYVLSPTVKAKVDGLLGRATPMPNRVS